MNFTAAAIVGGSARQRFGVQFAFEIPGSPESVFAPKRTLAFGWPLNIVQKLTEKL